MTVARTIRKENDRTHGIRDVHAKERRQRRTNASDGEAEDVDDDDGVDDDEVRPAGRGDGRTMTIRREVEEGNAAPALEAAVAKSARTEADAAARFEPAPQPWPRGLRFEPASRGSAASAPKHGSLRSQPSPGVGSPRLVELAVVASAPAEAAQPRLPSCAVVHTRGS